MNNINIITAFVAGLLSFLSPCVLPIIPGYISLLTGLSSRELLEEKDKSGIKGTTIINSIFFILGFTIIFILLQIVLRGLKFLIDQQILNYIFGSIIIIFGLHTLGLFKIKFLYYQKKINLNNKKFGVIGSLLIGIVFGFAWTPCIGPILAGILALASVQETIWKGTFLLLVYALGLGIPFLLTGIFLEYFLKFLSKITKYLLLIEIISGVLLIIIGLFIITGNLYKLMNL